MTAPPDGSQSGPLVQLVRRFYNEVWNLRDEAVARAILHPELSFRASLGPERTGPEGFIAYMRSIHDALGGYTCTIEELVATPDRVAARMRFSGLHQAPFFGVPATGRRITWAGAAFFTLAEGRIRTIWVLGDVDAVKAQLGAPASARMS